MKVYLLKQENYEDTSIYGIFTDKGKAVLEQRFIELGKQEADKEFQKLNTLINQYSDEARRLNEIQLPLLKKQQEAKANGDYELMKQIRKERHKPLKELESFNGGICRLRGKAIRLQNQTDEEYLKKYMCENHLYFSEYVIDDLPSPDYVASWRTVYEWEYPLQL